MNGDGTEANPGGTVIKVTADSLTLHGTVKHLQNFTHGRSLTKIGDGDLVFSSTAQGTYGNYTYPERRHSERGIRSPRSTESSPRRIVVDALAMHEPLRCRGQPPRNSGRGAQTPYFRVDRGLP